jgi:hypothetical protein
MGNGLPTLGNKAQPGQDRVRRHIWKLAFFVAGFAIVSTGFGLAAWTRYFDFQEDSDRSEAYVRSGSFIRELGLARVVNGVGDIILWFGTLIIFTFAIFVARKLKGNPVRKGVSSASEFQIGLES